MVVTTCTKVLMSVAPTPYRRELESLWRELGPRIGTLITEPYLGSRLTATGDDGGNPAAPLFTAGR